MCVCSGHFEIQIRRWVPPYIASLFINTLAQPTIWPVVTARCLLATTATAGGQNYHTQVSQVDSIQLQVSFAWDIKKLLKKQLLVLLKFIFHIVDVTYAVTMPTSVVLVKTEQAVIHNYYTLHVHTCNNTIGANPEEY